MHQPGMRAFVKRFLAYAAIAFVAFGLLSFSSDARAALSACETSYNAIQGGTDGCCQLVWTDPKNDKLCPSETDPVLVAMCFDATGAVRFGTGREAFECKPKEIRKEATESCRLRGGIYYHGGKIKVGGINCGCPPGTIRKDGVFKDSKEKLWPGCVAADSASTGGTPPPDAVDSRAIGVTFKPQVSIPFSTDFVRGQDVKVDGALIAKYVKAVYTFFLGITGLIAVVMFMVAGVQYMVSRDTKGAQAKTTMKNAALGMLAMFVTYQVLNTISGSLVEFKSLDVYNVTAENARTQGDRGCVEYVNDVKKEKGTAYKSGDEDAKYRFGDSKQTYASLQNNNYFSCHISKAKIPVYGADPTTGEFSQSLGACHGTECYDASKTCVSGACMDIADSSLGGTLANNGLGDITVENLYVYSLPYDGSEGVKECFQKNGVVRVINANLGGIYMLGTMSWAHWVACLAPDNTYPFVFGSFDIPDFNVNPKVKKSISTNDVRFGLFQKASVDAMNGVDRVALVANVHSTNWSILSGHCDGIEGAINDDDRYVFIGKDGRYANKISPADLNNYTFLKSELPFTSLKIDVSAMGQDEFCKL